MGIHVRLILPFARCETRKVFFHENRELVALVDGREPELLAGPIQDNADNGLLYLQQARAWFEAIDDAAPHQRPVLFSLATQSLDQAKVECPDLEQIEATRVAYTERQTP